MHVCGKESKAPFSMTCSNLLQRLVPSVVWKSLSQSLHPCCYIVGKGCSSMDGAPTADARSSMWKRKRSGDRTDPVWLQGRSSASNSIKCHSGQLVGRPRLDPPHHVIRNAFLGHLDQQGVSPDFVICP